MRLNDSVFNEKTFSGARNPDDPLYLWGILGSFIFSADNMGTFIDDSGVDRNSAYTWESQGGNNQYTLAVNAIDGVTQDSDMYQFTKNTWTTISTGIVNGQVREGDPPPYTYISLMPNYTYASQGNPFTAIGGSSNNDFIVVKADGVTIQE